ncbi:hypothetical protein TL16_g10966 [Triparma laevis f. inornata]|uniref:EF-hand domain-containing protein n=1 Tax=Triparma laevis f. inornata TaxID=1714386 RepID=A0A9W7BCA4_9STRA|nr:hypothetical protein TL16_g10966 [Triparma laevis f. inornata]
MKAHTKDTHHKGGESAHKLSIIAGLDQRSDYANKMISTDSSMALTSSMKALKKLKKMKKKVKDKLKKKARTRPWDKPDMANRLVIHRASVFGTIRSTGEHRQHYMGHCSLARKYEFNSPHHFTQKEHNKYKTNLICSSDSIASSKSNSTIKFRDDSSLASSLVSFTRNKIHDPDDQAAIPTTEFPRSPFQRKMIIARVSDDTLFYERKKNLYNILRDRYDPDHSESPMDPLYCFSALCMRESLLFHPEVRATLDEIWHITDADNNNAIDYLEYEKMHEAMSVAVYGANYLKKNEKIRRKLCLQDWNLDRDGQDFLDYGRFTMCWFQLADQFTDKIAAEDYISYLRNMFFKMVELDEEGRPKWKDDTVIAGINKSRNKAYDMDLSSDAVKKRATERQQERFERRSRGAVDKETAAAALRAVNDAKLLIDLKKEEEEEVLKRERPSMTQADAESKGFQIAEDVLKEIEQEQKNPVPVDGDLFDDIMNQYVDRSAFARHHRSSGDVNVKRRQSILKGGHIGMDQYEDEVARHKRLTAIVAKEDMPEIDLDQEGSVVTLEVSSIGSGSLVDAAELAETPSQIILREQEKQELVKTEIVIARRETMQMGDEEELVREVVKEEKRVEEEIKVKEQVLVAEQKYKEALERETMEFEENEQREVEHIIERRKLINEARKTLKLKELKAFEKYMSARERKRRKRRPMKGKIMIKGEVVEVPDYEQLRQPHLPLGGMNELVGRIRIKEKIDWKTVGNKLKHKRTDLGNQIEQRGVMTSAQILSMKKAAAKKLQDGLEDKMMVNGTWSKGTSHLTWSNSDCSAIPNGKRSTSLLDQPTGACGKKKTVYIVKAPRQWNLSKDKDAGEEMKEEDTNTKEEARLASDTPPDSPVQTQQQTLRRPNTTSGFRNKQQTDVSLNPFEKDRIPLDKRYAFETKKEIMMRRSLKSAERRRNREVAGSTWRPASSRRQKNTKDSKSNSRLSTGPKHTPEELLRIKAERGLFKSQQLSCNNWSPMMKKKMGKIFDEGIMGSAMANIGLTSSPIKKARPHTSHGRIAGRYPNIRADPSVENEGLMIASSSQEQLESIQLYKEASQVHSGTGLALEENTRSSVEVWTPEQGSLEQPSLTGSFASSHVRLIGDGIDKAEDDLRIL